MKYPSNDSTLSGFIGNKPKKSAKVVFFYKPDSKTRGVFIQAVVNDHGEIVDTEGNVYERDGSGKFRRVNIQPVIVDAEPVYNSEVGGKPKFGQLVYFPNGDVGRWQPNLETGEMELYLQKAKYVASLSPSDASRYGKHSTGGRVKSR